MLKEAFCQEPVLITPKLDQPFWVEPDSSQVGTGAVLSQKGEDGLLYPVAYYSKGFLEAERNYDIYDWELLAIIKAFEVWKYYLLGSPHQVTVLSDHKNLLYFKEARKLTRRQARYNSFLSQFDFMIHHISGVRVVTHPSLDLALSLCFSVTDTFPMSL